MSKLIQLVKNKFGDAVIDSHTSHGDATVVIDKNSLLAVSEFLKNDPETDMSVLMDLTAVDGLKMKWVPRFQTVYHFYSMEKNHRLRVKVPVDTRDLEVDSLTSLWPVANWFEREVWDMYGIRFRNHPDLKRILMYKEFEGHPLRKDYPYNRRQPLIGPKN